MNVNQNNGFENNQNYGGAPIKVSSLLQNKPQSFNESKFGNNSGTANFTGSMSGNQPDNQEMIALKRKVLLLENENKSLKEKEIAGLNQDMTKKATVTNDDRNWMNSFGA